ncbi:MAG: beta-ketoacyl synthase chain length factor [Bacteroidales bacterium]|nr:beta-ketoacyl synthase chain length factor [Bacteroidales bacterium]
MAAYINGIGLISPQHTTDPALFLPDVMEYTADFLQVINPNYKEYIHPLAARRMSKLIKMGITSAKIAMADAGCQMPDAIITGTGLGSVEDTEKILTSMNAGEQLMNPTPFIQSTYNTISSQIAITLQCHNYNTTYVHRSFSFESALQDALLQCEEKVIKTALVGGIDEMTDNHLLITRRAGHWKMQPVNNLKLLSYQTPGALAGEGSAFFLLRDRHSPGDYGVLRDVKTFFRPKNLRITEQEISTFLSVNNLTVSQLDAVILGYNGDILFDTVYDQLGSGIFSNQQQIWYKHLCGEYYTSTGFAVWLAANILKHQYIPAAVKFNNQPVNPLRQILLYNQYRNTNHSLILISR